MIFPLFSRLIRVDLNLFFDEIHPLSVLLPLSLMYSHRSSIETIFLFSDSKYLFMILNANFTLWVVTLNLLLTNLSITSSGWSDFDSVNFYYFTDKSEDSVVCFCAADNLFERLGVLFIDSFTFGDVFLLDDRLEPALVFLRVRLDYEYVFVGVLEGLLVEEGLIIMLSDSIFEDSSDNSSY